MFKIGQKVVCIDDSRIVKGAEIKCGEIYTIKDMFEQDGTLGLFFYEINNGAIRGYPNFWGYSAKRFRPVDDMWSDDILSKIIEEVETEELVTTK